MSPVSKAAWAIAVCLLASTPAAAQGPPAAPWVTSWQAAPSSGAGLSYEANPLRIDATYVHGLWNQTLRTIITPHAIGTEVRVKISNRYGGTRPLLINAATIAERATGRAIVPATLATLRFSGATTVTIPGGQEILSDPVPFASRPFTDLAISLSLGAPAPRPTSHVNGFQTSYVSRVGSGDHTASVDGSALRNRTLMRFFTTELHSRSTARAQTLVAIGDSITDGTSSPGTADRNLRWPDFLQRRLLEVGSEISVANAAIAAGRVASERAGPIKLGGPSIRRRFDSDALAAPTLGGIIVAAGTNDIGSARMRAEPLILELKKLAQRAHDVGVPIFIATITPFGRTWQRDNPPMHRARDTVNTWIRTQRDYDGVIDFARAVEDPANPLRMARAFDSGDHLHPSPAGYAAMADAIDLPLLRRSVRYPEAP